MLKKIITSLAVSAVAVAAAQSASAPVEMSASHSALETQFRDGVSADHIRENMRRLSARPHHVGSSYDKDNAEWLLAQFKSWGFDAHIETFSVLFPTPRSRRLELLGPTHFTARLAEPALGFDPTSSQTKEQLPTYNAYSADGDVTAPLVYVNYGNREDYEELDRLGISVKGAIVIARYGHGWRGIKPKVAAEHGAIGCIIYSDPAGDGYAAGDTYPKGGWRASEGVQRGSVMDTDYPGDPLTPEVGATSDAKRLDLKDVKTITRIPVLPISSVDATPLLAALGGAVVPEKWRGALPMTYHVGPGPAKVHLQVASNWDRKNIYDVIATLHGGDFADEWVLRGNHHDAWVNGAEDPLSGQSAMLEEARMLGALHAQGWTPRRTIIYCAWDGEEPGLLGSVEWVETHREELTRHAVAYINSDSNSRGFLDAGGTHDLQPVVTTVARDVKDPETGMSVYQRAHLAAIAEAKTSEERADLRRRDELQLEPLGDGSDFTAFQDFIGIPTLSIEFDGENDGTQYHSIYDDFYWYTHYVDTDFAYGRALAQTAGTAMMRLADAGLIPVDYVAQAEELDGFAKELQDVLKEKREEFTERNRQIEEGVFKATRDPHRPVLPPPTETVPPFMNFAPLQNALTAYHLGAERYARALSALQEHHVALDAATEARINSRLMLVSRALIDPKGLPERPWFKNQIYAPGAYTGYGAKPMAAVREYMDSKQWQRADEQVPEIAKVINAAATRIAEAAQAVEAAAGVGPAHE